MVATMTPEDRVKTLVHERKTLGRRLVFVAARPHDSVHVVGPDEDQPLYDNEVSWLLTRRFRTVCGRTVITPADEGLESAFADTRLCRQCIDAFNSISFRIGALVYEDNCEDVQSWARSHIAQIQQDKLRDRSPARPSQPKETQS